MAKSERAAWQVVLATQQAVLRALPHHETELREAAFQTINVAKEMLFQLGRGVHENPPTDGVSLGKRFSDRAIAIQYKHRDDKLDYSHDFKPGVELWKARMGGQDAVVIIGAHGQPITEEF